MDQTELTEILDKHQKWLREERGERAYLRGADLWRADLKEADLRGDNLGGADLRGANLGGADLTDAKGLVKLMVVEVGYKYWKRFDKGLNNYCYQFKVGLNDLREVELFVSDECV